jgi:hypothetical protein
MRRTITTLLAAAYLACGATATMAVEANRQGELRSFFDYNAAPVVPTGVFNQVPAAEIGYQVTDQPPAAPTQPAPAASDSACCDTACCSSCGCNDCCCGNSGWGCLGDCCLGEQWHLKDCLTPCCCGPNYGGWVSVGYYNHNERLSEDQSDGLAFRDFPHHLNIDQAWVWVEKVAEADGCCADWGYRFDAMYGVDAQFAQSFGNPRALNGPEFGSYDASFDHGPYGWAAPQAYVQYAQGCWSVKAGRFWTPAGYEVVPATGNFFYSHTLTHFNSEPFGHTGVLGSYSASDCMTYHVGWSLGWDTGFDQFGGGNIFIGGFTRTMNDMSFTYISTVGNFGWRSGDEFGHSHHLVLVNDLNACLKYVVTSDLLFTDGTLADDEFENNDYGVTNYLIYKYNDCWSVGGRFEWWKSNNVTGLSDSFQNVTGGLNYHAHANLVIRPEIRYDWVNEGDDLDDYNQTWFGVDAVLSF